MDNFRRFKAHHKKTSAVDGFLNQAAAAPRERRRPDTAFQTPIQPRLDNFKGREGFTPNAQPMIGDSMTAKAPAPLNPEEPVHGVDMTLPQAGKRSRKKRSKKKIILKSLAILCTLGLLVGGYTFGKAFLAVHGIFKGGGNAPALADNVDPTKLKGEGDGRVNVLLLGKGGPGHEAPDLTDTLLVASIDPVNKTASILSIPRDLWVKSPSGGQSKINAVYSFAKSAALSRDNSKDGRAKAETAGLGAIQSTIESTMGIPIHYYTMVDFVGFEQAINTVGGIDINVSANDASGIVRETLWDELTRKNYTLDVRAGNNHFDGQRALMYARSRHTSARGDFDRTERQRKIMIALKDKVISAGTYGNPVKINQLITNFGDHVQSNMSTGEIRRIYDLTKSIDSSKIKSVGLADPPNNYVTTGTVNGQSIVRPIAGLFDYSAIQNYVRNTLKDGFIQNENANIAVYNGSKITGLASKKATELRSYGYNITTVANALNNNNPQTILVDLTNGSKKYTKHYLEQRLKVTAVTSMPDSSISPAGADFVIILGQSESANQ